MLRKRNVDRLKGQVILEYALVVGAIILVMFAMSTLIKRGTQSIVKTVADQIGNQEGAEQKFDDSGHLKSSYTSSRTDSSRNIAEFVGDTTVTIMETTHSEADVLINLGFTEEFN